MGITVWALSASVAATAHAQTAPGASAPGTPASSEQQPPPAPTPPGPAPSPVDASPPTADGEPSNPQPVVATPAPSEGVRQPQQAGVAGASDGRTVEPPPPAPESQRTTLRPPPEDEEASDPPGVREHDGFFARLGTGFAPWSETLTPKHEDDIGGKLRIDTSGIAKVDDLTLGWSISRHWILGLSLQTASLLASNSSRSEKSTEELPDELDPGLRQMAMLGISALWFSNPKGGFNLGGGLALAGLDSQRVKDRNYDLHTQYRAGGLGLSVELGYTFWVSAQWSVGLRGRLNAAWLGGKDDNDIEWTHGVTASPGALFDIMFN